MEKKQNVPALRFQGFSGEWKDFILDECANRFDNLRIPISASNRVAGNTPYYGANGIQDYVHGYTHKGEYILIAEDGANDVNNYPIHYVNGEVWVNNHAHVLQGKSGIANTKFLKYALSKMDFQTYLVGGSRAKLNANIMMAMKVKLPLDASEQKVLGEFLDDVDSKILLIQQRILKLQQFRQAMLAKLFPREGAAEPELRFRGFSGKWRIRTLAKCAALHARIGWQNLRKSEFLTKGDYYLITGTDFVDGQIEWRTCHYVSKLRYDQDKNIQVQNGDILVTKDGTLGKVAYVDGADKPATLNAGVFNVKINVNDVDAKYLYQYLKGPYLMDYVNQRATGGTIKHLNQNILVDFPVVMPSFEEQKIIGDFFYRLDRYISLQQKKLERMQRLKAALLEKLFV